MVFNYINILIVYANINAPKKLYTLFLGLVYKTIIVAINKIVSMILLKSKYHIPIPKELNIIIASIPQHKINDILLLPLEYQQINARIGVNRVIIYQIII